MIIARLQGEQIMFNQVNLMGRITNDLEVKSTNSGTSVLNYTLAINNKYKDREETYFIYCVSYGKLAELIAQYSGKGNQILVSGELHTRNYELNGQKRITTEVLVNNVQFLSNGTKKDKPASYEPKVTFNRPDNDNYGDLPF